MDYQRVEARFRLSALSVQAVLVAACLLMELMASCKLFTPERALPPEILGFPKIMGTYSYYNGESNGKENGK